MIKDNILEVRKRVICACRRAKRDAAAIRLVAVSKNRSAEEIKEALLAGLTDFGENRVQEAAAKYRELSAIKWHMVGHLQTNKVKQAVKIFDLIQSVDSLRLMKEINKQAARIGKIQAILIEVKLSPEATKFGIKPDETAGVIKEAAVFKNIHIKGLMTIAPVLDNPQKSRPYFRGLRELRDKINALPVTRYQFYLWA